MKRHLTKLVFRREKNTKLIKSSYTYYFMEKIIKLKIWNVNSNMVFSIVLCKKTVFFSFKKKVLWCNGHILVDSPSIRRRNSAWKVRRNYIDFERWIHVEIMTSIRRGNFDVDSTFKIDEISMSSPCGVFDVVSTSN